MPLPFILGAGAVIAGAAGVGNAVHGVKKAKDANDKMKETEERHKRNIKRLERNNRITNEKMDDLGKLELEILKGFDDFSNTIEKIQNRPQFIEYNKTDIVLPKYDREELKNVSIGAGVLLGGLGGAAIGTAGGFAAAGAAASAVMALGTASTGTAIASLSGAAAVNATLAALGGGALAVGGGGIALGSTILGATTLGIGFLVGGMIFNFTGKKLSNQAEEAYDQMRETEITINKICNYLRELQDAATQYLDLLHIVKNKYYENFAQVFYLINDLHKVDWNSFSKQEKIATENTILLVGLLYKMCQVNLVEKAEDENDLNTVNQAGINDIAYDSERILNSLM